MSLSGSKRRYSSLLGRLGGTNKKRNITDFFGMSSKAYRAARRKVYRGAKRLKKYGSAGGMMATRNMPACYIAPATVLGSYTSCCGSAAVAIGNGGWTLGAAQASGGLIAGIYDVPFTTFTQLNQVFNYNDFTTLFDQYQIKSVTYYITLSQAAVSTLGTVQDTMLTQPSIMYFPDYDDGAMINCDAVRERMGVRQKNLVPGKTTKITLRGPKPDSLVWSGGAVAVSAVPKGSTWLDTANQQVPHWGLKGCFKGLDLRARTDPAYQITIEAKVKFNFKQVR